MSEHTDTPELIVPVALLSDEHRGSEEFGLVANERSLLFTDGSTVHWDTATIPASEDTPATHAQHLRVYWPNGDQAADLAAAKWRARRIWTGLLIDLALEQNRPELLPPSSLVLE